jgi:predicted transcriptional regulator
MKLKEIAEALDLRVYCGEERLQREVTGGYVSDLLSDVMGNASEGEVWITLQAHMNVVAIASLKELAAVVLINNIQPAEQVIAKAAEEGVPLLGTGQPAFEVAGKLYTLLNRE